MSWSRQRAERYLAQFPGAVTLRPSRLFHCVQIAVCFGLTALGIAMMMPDHGLPIGTKVVGAIMALLCGAIAIVGVMILLPGRAGLILGREGFTTWRFRSHEDHRWRDLSNFAVRRKGFFRNVTFENQARPVGLTSTDVLLFRYEIKPVDLVWLLAEWQRRALPAVHDAVPHDTVASRSPKIMDALAHFPGPLRLKAKRMSVAPALSIAAIILPIAAVMAFSRQPIGMVVTGLIMLWLMILFVPLLVPALPRVNDLELTPNGFGRMHSVLCRFTRWDQVPFFNPTAGSALVSYNDGKIMVRDWIAALLRKLPPSDFRAISADAFGLSAQELAALLSLWREKALARTAVAKSK